MLSKSQDSQVSAGRAITQHQQSGSSAVSSAEQAGLPLSAFGLNSHPSPGSNVTSQPQSQQSHMQIPSELVMKLLQVQQVILT